MKDEKWVGGIVTKAKSGRIVSLRVVRVRFKTSKIRLRASGDK